MNGSATRQFAPALAAAERSPDNRAVLENLAEIAVAAGEEERAVPLIRDSADRLSDARLWQWTGILLRALDEHEQALVAFEAAAAIDPSSASIAHGRARVALEAGVPAVDLFQNALRLSPANGEVLLGYVAAILAGGSGEQAESLLDHAVARSPFWLDGHVQLAQLRSKLRKPDLATRSIERAIASNPDAEPLWATLFGILLSAQDFAGLEEAITRSSASRISPHLHLSYAAIAAAELGRTDRADQLFGQMTDGSRPSVEVWRLRHLLRAGRIGEAVAALDNALRFDGSVHFWPYASVAWRLAADPRWEWLEGDLDRLVSVIDLAPDIADMGQVEASLRGLHHVEGQYLDQSVRGGSQTDGPLFSRVDPAVRTLRAW